MGQHLRFFSARSLARTLEAAGLAPDGIATAHATLVGRASPGEGVAGGAGRRRGGATPRRARVASITSDCE